MKKAFLLLAVFGAFVFTSCEEKTEETTTPTADTTSVTDDEAIKFNDFLVDNIDMSEVYLATLWDLDENNAPVADIITAAEKVKADLAERIKSVEATTPIGQGGQEFLDAAISHLYAVKDVAQVFIDFAEELSLPDEAWTEEQGGEWFNLAEPVFMSYNDSFSNLEMHQGNYATYQNIDIIPSEETLEELYDETSSN